MAKKTVRDVDLKGKKVLLRADFNVPMKDGKITDDNRIVQELPTIKYILEQGGRLIVFSHLGKIKTEEDKKKNSLEAVSKRLGELLGKEVIFVPETRGEKLEQAASNLKEGDVLMFENTRFEAGETKNDAELAAYWASLGEVFVNDAFGTSHRAHASNAGIASKLGAVSGFLMEKEINFLGKVLEPEKPFVAILGGAKVSDKILVIDKLMEKADRILIGGAMAFTFLKAEGLNVGSSLVEDDRLEVAKDILKKARDKGVDFVLPVDFVVAEKFENDSPFKLVDATSMPEGYMGLDVGPKTLALFAEKLNGAKTVVWNGPMGVFEMPNFAKGTEELCAGIAKLKDAVTVIGGGDSAAAAIKFGYQDDFTHVSTGGGASLELLEGKELPGIVSIDDKCCCSCKK